MWSGVLELNTLFKLHVSICKATEEHRGGTDSITDLCACHRQPFRRLTLCEGGRARRTEEMQKSGETKNTAPAVKGVPGDGGEYIVLDDAKLDAIRVATDGSMAAAAVVGLSQVPRERAHGLYYVRPDSKMKRSAGPVEVLTDALQREKKAIVAKWTPRGRELLVAIYPQDGALVLNVLMYESEIRPPDDKCLINRDGVTDAEVEVAKQVLATLPGDFNFAAAEDEAVLVRQRAIEAARNGEPIPTNQPAADTKAPIDLMAALLAARQGTPVVKGTRATGTPTTAPSPRARATSPAASSFTRP
jgi:DNA end-binding protein Ku